MERDSDSAQPGAPRRGGLGHDDRRHEVFDPGQDCVLGEVPGALAAMPDEAPGSEVALRAIGTGWELDARGAVSGSLMLRGRERDREPACRTRAGRSPCCPATGG